MDEVIETSAPEIEVETTPPEDHVEEVASETRVEEPKAPKDPGRHKIVCDGEEIQLTTEEALQYASLGRAAQKRFQEASQKRREVEEMLSNFKGNARQALQDPEIRKAFEDAYLAMAEFESLTPEQKAQKEKDEKLARYEEDEKRRKEQEEAGEFNKQVEHYDTVYQNQIMQALDSVNLPKNVATIKKIGTYMMQALEAGIEVTASDVAGFVRDDYVREIKETLSASDEATLFSLLGDDVAGKIRKADLARVKGSQTYTKKPTGQAPKSNRKGPMDLDSFLENL